MNILKLTRAYFCLLLLFPLEALARGGRGGETSGLLLLGLAAVFGLGLALSKVKADTWRTLGGILILLTGVAFVIQLVMFLMG